MDELKPGERKHETATLFINLCRAIPQGRMRELTRELSHLEVPLDDRRKGYATQLMHNVCTEADLQGKTLLVFVQPFGDIELSRTQLRDWYARLGFMVIQEDPCMMARLPGGTPRTVKPLTQAVGMAIEAMY